VPQVNRIDGAQLLAGLRLRLHSTMVRNPSAGRPLPRRPVLHRRPWWVSPLLPVPSVNGCPGRAVFVSSRVPRRARAVSPFLDPLSPYYQAYLGVVAQQSPATDQVPTAEATLSLLQAGRTSLWQALTGRTDGTPPGAPEAAAAEVVNLPYLTEQGRLVFGTVPGTSLLGACDGGRRPWARVLGARPRADWRELVEPEHTLQHAFFAVGWSHPVGIQCCAYGLTARFSDRAGHLHGFDRRVEAELLSLLAGLRLQSTRR
jgi:hypothetical protein